MPMLHEPETLEAMRGRFPDALAVVYRKAAVLDGSQPQPGTLRRHVFDFGDGLRLIVSRDDMERGRRPYVHLSASAEPGSPLHDGVRLGLVTPARFLNIATARYREISGDTARLELSGFSEGKRVPHWFREDC